MINAYKTWLNLGGSSSDQFHIFKEKHRMKTSMSFISIGFLIIALRWILYDFSEGFELRVAAYSFLMIGTKNWIESYLTEDAASYIEKEKLKKIFKASLAVFCSMSLTTYGLINLMAMVDVVKESQIMILQCFFMLVLLFSKLFVNNILYLFYKPKLLKKRLKLLMRKRK